MVGSAPYCYSYCCLISKPLYPLLDSALRRCCILFITIKDVVGDDCLRCCLCDNFYTAGQSAGTMGAEKIYLFSLKVILLQKGKQRHGYTIPPVGISKKDRIVLIQILNVFL